MNKKETLKAYLRNYGEVEAIQNISSILQELSSEWASSLEESEIKTPIAYALSCAAFKLIDAATTLKLAENHWQKHTDTQNKENADLHETLQKEYDMHYNFFQSLSAKDFAELVKNNQEEMTSKIKRLEFLKQRLQEYKNQKPSK